MRALGSIRRGATPPISSTARSRKERTGKSWENRSPLDNSLIGRVPEGGKAEVDAAVRAARAALDGPWGAMTVAQRTDLLAAVADEINARFDEFLAAECLDTGKPYSLASHIDIPRGAANFKMFAETVKNVATETFILDTPDGKSAVNYGLRRPKGVIAVISPWNLPLLLMTWKVGPALACGNTVIVKPSEETPLTATLLGEVMNKVGVPKGVYNVVHGLGPNSAGEFLTQHPLVNGITFTGETRTGEAIMRQAAHGIRQVSFELGGKNPAIVFADCDLDKAIEGTHALGLRQLRTGLPRHRARLCRAPDLRCLCRAAEGRRREPEARPSRRPRHQSGSADQPGASREGAVLLPEGARRGRDFGRPAAACPTCPAICARAPGSSRRSGPAFPTTPSWSTRRSLAPAATSAPSTRKKRRSGSPIRTPYGLAAAVWTENLSRGHRVAAKMDVGICWVNSLVPARSAHGLRRRQAVRHRPRRRRPFAGVLHRTHQRLHQALSGNLNPAGRTAM